MSKNFVNLLKVDVQRISIGNPIDKMGTRYPLFYTHPDGRKTRFFVIQGNSPITYKIARSKNEAGVETKEWSVVAGPKGVIRDRQTKKFIGLPQTAMRLYYEKLDEIDEWVSMLVKEAHHEQIGSWANIVRTSKMSMKKNNPSEEHQLIRYWLNLQHEEGRDSKTTSTDPATFPRVTTNFRDRDGSHMDAEVGINSSNEGASAVLFLCFGSVFVTNNNTASIKIRVSRMDYTRTNDSTDREVIIDDVPDGVDYGDVDATNFVGVGKKRAAPSDDKENKAPRVNSAEDGSDDGKAYESPAGEEAFFTTA
jgi:hypothetical protein